jgi:hypothetical protein
MLTDGGVLSSRWRETLNFALRSQQKADSKRLYSRGSAALRSISKNEHLLAG